ncbi:PPE family protein [uncultured Mycobacterium sp.]|uniref:PPE family protein n=1 Tax=uncultured Mycobacterium sp. TaxID=171292 RepID=UPI0035CA1987
MYFAGLPPEINSGRMFAGPGSGSLLAAAAAWDGLASELRSAAASYSSVIAGLSTSWQGPSSVAMATATTPYVAWMNATAAQAEHTAGQARAAAAAYQTAFAATVPPPAIAANRSLLASLVAPNIFGQNTAAIANTEALYSEMWAQDAAAMTTYASQSAAATQVRPFNVPPSVTNPAGTAGQAAAVGQAAGTAAGTNAQSTLSQLVSATPRALNSLAAPAAAPAAADPPSPITTLLNLLGPTSPLSTAASLFEAPGKAVVPATDAMVSNSVWLVAVARTINDRAVTLEGPLLATLGSGTSASGAASMAAGGPAVSAGMGGAGVVGALSVPPSWAAATPTVRLAASVLQGTSAAAAPAVATEGAGTAISQLALASLAGGALGRSVPRGISVAAVRKGAPSPGKAKDKDSDTPDKLKQVLAEASQKPESVQHWHTDKEHLESLLDQLSKKPGIHAVHVSKGGKNKVTPPRAKWG